MTIDPESLAGGTECPTILLLGPTAAGKTALAIELARRLTGEGQGAGGECVSADSMQVYRGMDIGTAKTMPDEWRGVPHHLIDIVDPSDDSFSVDRWLELCAEALQGIRERGRTPIIVGGTNLYVQALLGGMSVNLPAPDDGLRARLNGMSLEDLRARLDQVDPPAAQRIHFNDRKRTVRAIEVFEQTGARLSEMQTQWSLPPTGTGGLCGSAGGVFIVGLDYPIEALNRRINARVKLMMKRGLVEEVRRLWEARRLGRNAREALGYKQVTDHLEGRYSLDEAVEQIKIRTRRFAKQQRTWLRRFRTHQPSAWLNADDASLQSLADQVLTAIDRWAREPRRVSIDADRHRFDPGRRAS